MEQLSSLLKDFGEKLHPQEMDEFVRTGDPDKTGFVRVADFVARLCRNRMRPLQHRSHMWNEEDDAIGQKRKDRIEKAS